MSLAGHYNVSIRSAAAAPPNAYQKDYSQSTGAVTHDGTSTPYALNESVFGGKATSTGSITCSGSIVVTFTYAPTDGSDLPPPVLQLAETSMSNWSGPMGSCAGCWDLATQGQGAGSSGSSRTTLVTNPGMTFTRTYNPFAKVTSMNGNSIRANGTVTGGGGGGPTANTASVTYSVNVYPIFIQMGGVTVIGGLSEMLVGQPFTATVIDSIPGDSCVWAVTAPNDSSPFSSYQIGTSSAQYLPYTIGAGTNPPLQCYFATAGSPRITFVIQSKIAGLVDASEDLQVQQPAMGTPLVSCGKMALLQIDRTAKTIAITAVNPTDYMLFGASITGQNPWGILFSDSVADPPGFGQELATWGYVQVLTDKAGGKGSGLDNFYPYLGWYPADSSDRVFSDAPDIGGLQTASHPYGPLNFDSDYSMNIFYNAPGSNVVPVPLLQLNWTAAGQCSVDANGVWSQKDNGSQINSTLSPPFAFPEWTQVIKNG